MSAPRRGPHHGPRIPLTVGVIGTGRVGIALGAALAGAGHRVVAVTRGSDPDRLRARLPSAAVVPAEAVARAATDLLLLSVPDDRLAPLVAELAEAAAVHRDQVVAHTSGAHGTPVLAPATARGARPLALHPAMTFTGEDSDSERLPGISYGVTAPTDLRPFAARLVADLGGEVEWVTDVERPLYHAALAHGANHLVTLVNEAADWLQEAGVARPERLLAPLLRAALENTLRLGDQALTGPVVRGDAGTVAGHLRALARFTPDSRAAYRSLARRTVSRAAAAGRLGPGSAEPVLAALDDRVREPV
jgi:predicted short-subunit dehydrogenase-like oxidoreductase (DUF2520 family)